MTDQSFAIDITALQDDLYRIHIETGDGEWTTEVVPLIEKTEIRDCLALLSRGSPALTNDEQEKIRLFGEKLFNFLIGSHGEILAAYWAALETVDNQRLFIRLCTENAGRFAAIPWEYLYDPDSGFLGLSRQTPLIRWKPELPPRPPAPFMPPLKALIVTASPPNYPPINIETEWAQMSRATADLQASGYLQLEHLEHATWPAVRRRLRAADYQIIHYIGHTYFDEPTAQGFLALEDEGFASGSRPISAAELGNEIGPYSTIRLVILDSQLQSVGGDNKAALTIGKQLLQAGLAGVLAVQYPLNERAAAIMRSGLYQPLCEGHSIEAAVNVVRREIADDSLDWGKLALFLRAPYGRLFHPIAKKQRTK